MSNPDDEHGTPIAPLEAPKPPAFSSLMSRRLHTFGSPDLEVAVGKTELLYHYHALSLASQSLYVDTLLSSPAAKREQEKWRISFPEIEVETWEKMMRYLAPGEHPTLDDLEEIIPFYDQFQFQDGLRYCDIILSKYIPNEKDHFQVHYSFIPKLSRLVSFTHQLNFFPLSKPLAVKWATRCLKRFSCVDEDMIRLLMPLVENDDEVIKAMVSTYLGRKCKGMTMNEMRDLIETPDFPEKCISRCRQIKEIDEQRRYLQVEALEVVYGSATALEVNVSGQYQFYQSSEFRSGYGSKVAEAHKGGAAVGCWRKMLSNIFSDSQGISNENITIESLDVFGSVWEIYQKITPDSDDERGIEEGRATQNRRVLLRWEDGISTSLIPPKQGWKVVDEGGDAFVATKIQLRYSIGEGSSY